MGDFTVTIIPSDVNDIGAKWCIVGKTPWFDSEFTTTRATLADVISFSYVEGYISPSNITITEAMLTAEGTSATYVATQWLASWGPPMCGCLFKGQVLLGGSYNTTEATFPSDSRIVRWSEIGAFRFLGATANTKKNEAGFAYMGTSSDETVMALLPLKNSVVTYTTMSVSLLSPVASPAPTYSFDTLLSNIGIMNPLAAAGDGRNKQLYVDREGELREISMGQYGQGYVSTALGYRHIFKPMQEDFSITTGKGLIVVTYNQDEDEFYISNGLRSFVYTGSGLTEIGVAITSVINLRTSLIAQELFIDSCTSNFFGGASKIMGSEYVYIETDVVDFNLSAIKTIQQVEIGGSIGSNSGIMIKWRNSRSEAFRSTGWVRCSPNGVSTPIVSGTDFKICIMSSPVESVEINNITVEWKLTDKTSVRGNYASGSAA